MKTIFIKKECILIQVWNETILVNNELKNVVCTDILKVNNVINKMYIINVAFQTKKNLDKRDVFQII